MMKEKSPMKDNVRKVKEYFPQIYEIFRKVSFEELIGLLEKNRDHSLFKEKIRKCISEEGKKFLKEMFKNINDYSENE